MRGLAPTTLAGLLVVPSLLGAPPALAAQEGTLGEIILVEVRSEHRRAFEAGTRTYFEEVRRQDTPHAWLVWEVITGENTGSYYVGSFDHTWADFDMMPADPATMLESFEENVRPHVESFRAGFWQRRADLSYETGMEDEAIPAFEQLYYIKPSMAGAFEWEELVGELVAAAEAADWQMGWGVFQLVNGGELPQYVIAIVGDSFADFAEPSPNMMEMLSQHVGQQRAMEIFQRLGEVTDWEKSEMIAWREDLSYIP